MNITAEIPLFQQEIIEKASKLKGISFEEFLIESAVKEARKILDQESVISLSEKDADLVFSLIENPPQPNQNLLSAIKKYQDFFHETN